MRTLFFIVLGVTALVFGGFASAQEAEPETQQKQDSQQEPDSQDKTQQDEAEKDPEDGSDFDAEGYFKRGEDGLYKGSNCAPPPDLTT